MKGQQARWKLETGNFLSFIIIICSCQSVKLVTKISLCRSDLCAPLEKWVSWCVIKNLIRNFGPTWLIAGGETEDERAKWREWGGVYLDNHTHGHAFRTYRGCGEAMWTSRWGHFWTFCNIRLIDPLIISKINYRATHRGHRDPRNEWYLPRYVYIIIMRFIATYV